MSEKSGGRLPYFDGTRAEFEEKLRQGNELLKVRAKSRKHIHKVLGRQRELDVKDRLWKEIEEVETCKAKYEEAQAEFAASKDAARRNAEAEAREKIHPFRVESKRSGIQEFESLKGPRKTKRYKGFAYLLGCVLLLIVEPHLLLTIGSDFRVKLHEILSYSPESIQAKMSCFGVEGYTLDLATVAGAIKPKCESVDDVKLAAQNGIAKVEYYLYNVTNPEEVEGGATPVVNRFGPLVFGQSRRRGSASFAGNSARGKPLWLDVDEVDFLEYVGDPKLLDVEVNSLNLGLQEVYSTLADYGVDENTFVAWMISSALQEVEAEIQALSSANPGYAAYEIWAGVGAWSVSSTNCPCFRFDRSLIENSNNCSSTLGCFLYQENFQRLVSQGEQYSSFSGGYLEKLPVFHSEALSSNQAKNLWQKVSPGSANCTLEKPSMCESLYQTFKGSGLGFGTLNLAELLKAFGVLWRHDEELPLLLGRNLVLFEEGINSNSLANFYVTIKDSNARCAVATGALGQLACTQLNDVTQYLHRLFLFKQMSLYGARNPAKGLFARRTARELLLTGYPAAALALTGKSSSYISS